MDVDIVAFEHLGLALALGLLIGLERGWQGRAGAEGSRVAGIRTFGIIGLLGGLSAHLSARFGLWLPTAAFLLLASLMIAAYVVVLPRRENVSATTTVAALVTFLLGALSAAGEMELASASAVAMTLLLGTKPILHAWVARIAYEELLAVLKLLLISVVLLPVLPNRGYGPWQALNPYEIWWLVVLIAGLSFAGYVAVRALGSRRGVMATALLGGLTSSTVVTLTFARLSRHAAADRLLAAGTAAASATMFLRVLVVLAILAPALLDLVALPIAAAAVVTLAGAAWLARRDRAEPPVPELRLDNPFEFGVALRFGALLAFIMLLARAIPHWLGLPGLYALAAVSGAGDVDAIVLSMARLAGGPIEPPAAAIAVTIAVFVNSVAKVGMALAVGAPGMARRVALVLGLAVAVGAAAAFALAMLAPTPGGAAGLP